jgi:hypothetical protein
MINVAFSPGKRAKTSAFAYVENKNSRIRNETFIKPPLSN